MILVIGEALIDLIENRYQAGSFNAIVGGANANVALALARRGAEHTFYARMSRDRFGDIIRKRLDLKFSLHSMLQILSVTPFEKIPMIQILTYSATDGNINDDPNQLILL